MAEGISPWRFHNTTQSGHRDGGEEGGLNHLQMVCAQCVAESRTRRGGLLSWSLEPETAACGLKR